MPREPLDQEVETPAAAFGTDAPAPRGPPTDQIAQAQHAPDLAPGGVIQKTGRRPVAIEAPHRLTTGEQRAKAGLIDVVVPDIREPRVRPARTSRLVPHGTTVPPGSMRS